MTIGSRMSYDASYVKARKKAVKQLKNSNAQQLEIETLKMEERIRALKEQMFKEKEEREKQGGIRWASGKSGPLNSHAQDVLKKKNLKTDKTPKKIKILGDEPLHSYKKKVTPRVQQQDNFGTSGCGQCERTKATLVCIECEEKYCVSCFMSFHQKGALTKHTTQSLEQYEAELQIERDSDYTKHEITSSMSTSRFSSGDQARSSQMNNSRGKGGGALLQGSYNEEESAQSFAQALMEWRNSGKEEKMQKNPTNAKSSSCETGTTPQPTRHQEVKVNFGPNKSLSYLDRMLLKKLQGDQTFGGPQAPSKGKKYNSSELSLNTNSDTRESPKNENQLGTNYREIFQSLGAPDRKASQENFQMPPKSVISIEEVNDADLSGEETTACIVEEEDFNPHPQRRPLSRTGRLSVMCMTPTGRFEANTDALVVEDIASVPAQSLSLGQATPRSKQTLRSTSSRQGLHMRTKSQLDGSVGRVWSPQPHHVGLSEFFLAGVRGESVSGRTSRERKTIFDPVLVKPERLSKALLSQHVWKPQESVFSSNDIDRSNKQQQQPQLGKDDDKEARTDSPRPVIPLLRAPELLETRNDRPDSQSSTIVPPTASDSGFTNDTMIHDFGIVDFLRAPPYLPKGFEDYSQVHRVSTVSPLTLSPNPPSFHWSDDSDDDFLAQVCFQGNQDDQRADQDEDDRATLTNLAWELASTTGRLTQCELDDKEGEGEEEFDEDSIESNDFGSGLSSSEEDNTSADTYSANVDSVKHNDDNTLAEEEVHALE